MPCLNSSGNVPSDAAPTPSARKPFQVKPTVTQRLSSSTEARLGLVADDRVALVAELWNFGSLTQTFCANSNWRTRLAQPMKAAMPRSDAVLRCALRQRAARRCRRGGSSAAGACCRRCRADSSAGCASRAARHSRAGPLLVVEVVVALRVGAERRDRPCPAPAPAARRCASGPSASRRAAPAPRASCRARAGSRGTRRRAPPAADRP